ncbi:PP2C family protein-serine/threonine phosphatase [Actinotalea sp. K2]|uniref:PP2C family protein-serine/threonine phosphatase n=1 Tax=Actinotalea sp. K2 TaxID=2939438 RepID=UPI00201788D3|nr:PP2C family protein-serine/threonine phosphatase [Actinotalea sp. K2]MCL3860318.1 serine/threonine-protein phosphatase [Actinotalea sp. K2]
MTGSQGGAVSLLDAAPRRRRRRARPRRPPAIRQTTAGIALSGLALLAGVGIALHRDWVPASVLLLIVLLGVFVLRLRAMVVLCLIVIGLFTTLMLSGVSQFNVGTLTVHLLGIGAGLAFVRSRDRLGLQGATSDLMLVDLRDRLVAHGRIPALPTRWRVDSVVRSAYGEAFSGDFVVASRSRNGLLLEIVLVDVSGKGQEAGVRSLLLSGAFGGLLGAMPREAFLPAANSYLLGQDWPEGFATAVHLAVRLDTGEFWVSTAGHPPAIQLHAGSGRIELIDTSGGPALGVVLAPVFSVHSGVMQSGDTLMLYTDGLVEAPGADVELGIDRLMGEAERVVATRTGGAEAVLAGVRAGDSDDRALILVHHD